MTGQPIRRILVVTDHAAPVASISIAEFSRRAASRTSSSGWWCSTRPGQRCTCCIPERHDKAVAAERRCAPCCPISSSPPARHIIGSVSVRHDPMDAIEETIFTEPIDEILLAVHEGHLRTRIHQDLPHRLAHLNLPVTRAPEPGARAV